MNKLISKAREARKKAYAPYSKFKVGAAIESVDGRVFTGCNVENASHGVACCAERVALYKAVSQGAKSFRRIAIVTDTPVPTPPCGICRQALCEFSKDIEVVMTNMEGRTLVMSIKALLPYAFVSYRYGYRTHQ